MSKTTPKNFILQIGALIALYVSVTAILILIFSVTNLKFPDAAASSWETSSAREAVRGSIAMLLVFFPAFLVFTRLSNQDRRKYTQGEYNTLARWAVYASILGGILILLGDLVTLINFFLNGEITQRFLIKVFALIIVVGLTLHYYILDIRGFFKKRADKAMYFAFGALSLVIVSLAYGYSYIETPSEVRAQRIDQQQISDLQDIQWRIDDWYVANKTVPDTLTDLYNGQKLPTAPEEREAYTYNKEDSTHYELCATFERSSGDSEDRFSAMVKPIDNGSLLFNNNNWEHEAGRKCFQRIIIDRDEFIKNH
jgi:hypothetical protein